MQKVLFSSSFFCEHCNESIPVKIFGDDSTDNLETLVEKQEAKEWAGHFHWIDHHQRCAICGEIVKNESTNDDSLELAFPEEVKKFHPLYLKETAKEQPTDSFPIVHYSCLRKE